MGTNKFNNIDLVSYEQVKNQINTGDLLLCSGRYLVSKLIKKFSDSIFSHVAIFFYWNDHLLVLESVEDDGVRALPFSHYLNNYENSNEKYNGELYIARHKRLTSENFNQTEIKRMLQRAIELLNRNYDKNEIAEIVARISLGFSKHKDDNQYICSEFVDECFKQLDVNFPRDSNGFIYPEHIAADPNIIPLFHIES